MHLGFGAITNQVDRIDARTARKNLCHLGYAVTGRVEHVHFDVGADAVEELLVVADARGQKHDFLAGSRCIKRRQGIEESLVAGRRSGRFSGRRSGRGICCRSFFSREGCISLALRDLLGGNLARCRSRRAVEHDARFERKQ